MWIRCNPNPKGKTVDDCVVRAIAVATGRNWYDVYDALCDEGRRECNMPSVNSVWGKYLYDLGFEPFIMPEACPKCVTVRAFCQHYRHGTYIIGTGNHAVAVIDGNYIDAWDSGNETLSYFWRVKKD